MCVVCGCSNASAGQAVQAHGHADNPGQVHPHDHGAAHEHPHGPGCGHHHNHGDLHFGSNEARVSVPGMSAERAIKLEADVLGANNAIARSNREHFRAHGVAAYNLVSSPGSGKTTLLEATIRKLQREHPERALAVIEGDQQTSNDADRIRATGAPAVQVNTGKGCHLDAPMVAAAFGRLHAHHHDDSHNGAGPQLLFIENVGNLVCPAMWDLGERAKVAILSVTEGEDKPLKYPDMFAAAQLMILTKIDLLPHLDFDVAKCIAYAQRVNPRIEVLILSSKNGAGMDAWIEWLLDDAALTSAAAMPHAHAVTHEAQA